LCEMVVPQLPGKKAPRRGQERGRRGEGKGGVIATLAAGIWFGVKKAERRAERGREYSERVPYASGGPLSRERGTFETVKDRFWLWLSGRSPQTLLT